MSAPMTAAGRCGKPGSYKKRRTSLSSSVFERRVNKRSLWTMSVAIWSHFLLCCVSDWLPESAEWSDLRSALMLTFYLHLCRHIDHASLGWPALWHDWVELSFSVEMAVEQAASRERSQSTWSLLKAEPHHSQISFCQFRPDTNTSFSRWLQESSPADKPMAISAT